MRFERFEVRQLLRAEHFCRKVMNASCLSDEEAILLHLSYAPRIPPDIQEVHKRKHFCFGGRLPRRRNSASSEQRAASSEQRYQTISHLLDDLIGKERHRSAQYLILAFRVS